MPYVKGQSGNLNGRPPMLRDFRSRCLGFMTRSGWAALESLASNPKSVHHYRALELISAYAYGRPTQLIAADPDAEVPAVIVSVQFDRANEDTLSLPDAS